DTFTNVISGILPLGSVNGTATLDLRGVGFETTALLGANNVVSLSGGSAPVTLNFDPTADFSGYHASLASDGAGGTVVSLALNTTAASAQQINDILARMDDGGRASVANTHYPSTLPYEHRL